MSIKTSTGAKIDGCVFLAGVFRGHPRLIVEMGESVTMAQAVAALDGAAWIRVEKDAGVATTYEGYNKIALISRATNGSVRVTLEGEENDG